MSQHEAAACTHDEFCRAIETGDPFYLACPNGHGSVPPRRACPHCGAQQLTVEVLPDIGQVKAATVVHVATSAFADSAPYVTAIADFGPVSLTGVIAKTDTVEHGMDVTVSIKRTDERSHPTLVFEPQ